MDLVYSYIGRLRRILKSLGAETLLREVYRRVLPESVRARVTMRSLRDRYGDHYEIELHGEEVLFSIRDEYSFRWFLPRYDDEIHEPGTTHLFARLACSSEGIVDIGANLGWFTCIGAVLSDGTLYSFEMDEDNVERLRSNVELNGQKESVHVEQVAVTDDIERTSYFKSSRGASPVHKLSAEDGDRRKRVEVPSTTLDSYCQGQVEALDLLKVDVEGGELKVLTGAVETLQRFHPDLLIEVHPKRLRESGDSPQEVLKLLVENGYAVQRIIDFHNQGEVELQEVGLPADFSPSDICMLYATHD